MEAKNKSQLARMLARPVMAGLNIMSKQYLIPDITNNIKISVKRGEYHANAGGSLSKAWSTHYKTIGLVSVLGEISTYYDSDKLVYEPNYYGYGKHMSPWEDGEKIENMAILIDRGLGGSLYGTNNPTRKPTNFWTELIIPSFEFNQREWIESGLRQAGLTVL